MKRNLWLLAVTKMEHGFCLAGVAEDSAEWIRPVRPAMNVTRDDLIASDGRTLGPFDLVELNLVEHRPAPPHSEDWITNFNRMPSIVRRPSDEERLAVLERAAESSAEAVLTGQERSLVLIEPDEVSAVVLDAAGGRFRVRVSFVHGDVRYDGSDEGAAYPCTDLKFRAWARRFASRTKLGGEELRRELGTSRMFVAVGLGREFEGRNWPLIVGVHTVPDYAATIDLANP
jgi:hypothetical protein